MTTCDRIAPHSPQTSPPDSFLRFTQSVVPRARSSTEGLALRADSDRGALAVDASRSPAVGERGGRGGDSVLCRASCPAPCGRKWSTNEVLSR
jgi:hypothetical protein